jgi:hypothetical protein
MKTDEPDELDSLLKGHEKEATTIGLLMGVFEAVEKAIKRERVRVDALEQRTKGLEDRPQLEYRGVFQEGSAYLPGNVTTFQGSMWICRTATMLKPGDGSSSWQLACKRGRDGKDAGR